MRTRLLRWAPFGFACALVLAAAGLYWPQIPAALGQVLAAEEETTPGPAPDDPARRPVANDCSGGVVYLTFDDGPFTHTPALLDRLAALDLKATFFVVGDRIPGREELVRRELAEGHSVQAHTFHHTNLVTGVDVHGVARQPWGEPQIRVDLQRNVEAIVAAGAPRPTQYRPPYGDVTPAIDRIAAGLGLRLVMPWNSSDGGNIVDSNDTGDGSTTAGIVANVTSELTAESIVAMHDGSEAATLNSIEALQAIVDDMNAKKLCSSVQMRPDATGGVLG